MVQARGRGCHVIIVHGERHRPPVGILTRDHDRDAALLQRIEDRLLTVRDRAGLLQVPPKTIYTWRYKGIGPPAIPVGRYLRFRAEDVVAWLEARADAGARVGVSGAAASWLVLQPQRRMSGRRSEHGRPRAETGHRSPLRSKPKNRSYRRRERRSWRASNADARGVVAEGP